VAAAWHCDLLMDAADHLARDRGIAPPGITVGLFDEYGPAQRLYGRDERGARRPHEKRRRAAARE